MPAKTQQPKNQTQRAPTGIKGFDSLVQGGLPRGKTILLCGTPGTGKTIFALEYLYRGAKDFNEKGLYVSIEEDPQSLRNQASQFGWNIEALEKKGMLKLYSIAAKDIRETTVHELIKLIKEENYQRLVLDSLSALSINIPSTFTKVTDITSISIKRFMYHFISELKVNDICALLISQATSTERFSQDGVSEFVCDGIISINYESLGGDFSRSLIIRKMRETKNNEDVHPLEIGNKGIVIHSTE